MWQQERPHARMLGSRPKGYRSSVAPLFLPFSLFPFLFPASFLYVSFSFVFQFIFSFSFLSFPCYLLFSYLPNLVISLQCHHGCYHVFFFLRKRHNRLWLQYYRNTLMKSKNYKGAPRDSIVFDLQNEWMACRCYRYFLSKPTEPFLWWLGSHRHFIANRLVPYNRRRRSNHRRSPVEEFKHCPRTSHSTIETKKEGRAWSSPKQSAPISRLMAVFSSGSLIQESLQL